MKVARDSGLSAKVLKIMDAAPNYAEGTFFRLEVASEKDLATIKQLAMIKAKT